MNWPDIGWHIYCYSSILMFFDSSRSMKNEKQRKNDEKQECVHTHIVFDYYYCYYYDGCRMIWLHVPHQAPSQCKFSFLFKWNSSWICLTVIEWNVLFIFNVFFFFFYHICVMLCHGLHWKSSMALCISCNSISFEKNNNV